MSFRDHLFEAFPSPSSIVMPAAGIDISDSSIKCIFLRDTGFGSELKTFIETPLNTGVVVGGDIENRAAVIEVLRSFRLRHGVRYASVALPERKAYLYQTLVPTDNPNLQSGVEFDFEAHVPLPPGEALFDFEVVRKISNGTVVAVTAYAKRIVNEYVSIFKDAGIVLRSLEVESQAFARAVLSKQDFDKTVMLVDLGKKGTRVAIAENGIVSFTATLDIGGDMFTGALVKRFGISEAEAEALKNEQGFVMTKENTEVVETLMITASVLKEEISKHVSYWANASAEGIPRRPVEKILLAGGTANLSGFPEYLGGSFTVPVVVANVWTNAFSLNSYVPSVSFADSLEYATAVGLAIRGIKKTSW